jgi:Flp pilus assembly protein TadD
MKGEFDKAIADYTEAIRLEPQSVRAFDGRGWCYKQKGDNGKAVADFAQAKKLGYKAKSQIACALHSLMWWRNR